ncbi:5,6-dimethylbenzimidazole synthase [Iodobacter sp. CM08]|uniref:5,6-dimethylbenzimidazole synthase n=1 Tax=Iodobacter sp. CM08 TaxID=3085902 RepID=UPI002981C1CC|nr:5,6-dimethylbenzimidazole synthase [Iodobacter sp. CM08]MDW5416253.1 5,6-dimethylbenzimidazole synthase [Iodobacter sp. CM08]
MPNSHRFLESEIESLTRLMSQRRDIRQFKAGALPDGLMPRLIEAAQMAPSVGFMQPWRFLHITDGKLRQQVHALVDAERERTSAALPSRQQEFMKLKVDGLAECAEVLVVALMDGREKHIFGRRTLPEMDLASASCAIQNMWLLARAEGIGMGWVSIFDPADLAKLLKMPEGAKPIAILCLGQVEAFPEKPTLERLGWGCRLEQEQIFFENSWPEGDHSTPISY